MKLLGIGAIVVSLISPCRIMAFGVYRYPGPGPRSLIPGDGGWEILIPSGFVGDHPTAFGRQLVIGEVIKLDKTVEIMEW